MIFHPPMLLLAFSLIIYLAAPLIRASSPTRAVLKLTDENFDAVISDSSYISILFSDGSSSATSALASVFEDSAQQVFNSGKFCATCNLAIVNTEDKKSKQIMQVLSVRVPSIKVFRFGGMYDYLGPLDDALSMARYLMIDATPPVTVLAEFKELKALISKASKGKVASGFDGRSVRTIVGYFSSLKVTSSPDQEKPSIEGSSSGSSTTSPPSSGDVASKAPWINFMESAEMLRRQANFYAFSNPSIMKKLKPQHQSPPFVFMILENGELQEFPAGRGFSEATLKSWILYNSDVGLVDLSSRDTNSDVYISKFVSHPFLKFTLFIDTSEKGRTITNSLLSQWDTLRSRLSSDPDKSDKSNAILSFTIGNADPEVFSFYHISPSSSHTLQYPFIAAYNPKTNLVYKSDDLIPDCLDPFYDIEGLNPTQSALTSCDDYYSSMLKFVLDVSSGSAPRFIRSQERPAFKKGQKIIPLVGTTVLEAVKMTGRDIMLLLYKPYSQKNRDVRSSFELLGKAFNDEPRILLFKMDASANEVPSAWNINRFPIVLWFPAIPEQISTNNTAKNNFSNSDSDNDFDFDDDEKSDSKSQSGAVAEHPRMPVIYSGPSYSIFDLISFIRKMSTFDPSSIKISDSIQLNKLAELEESTLNWIEFEERHSYRNEGREPLANPVNEYLFGEIIYDGKRWHMAAAVVFLVVWIVSMNRLINLQLYTEDMEKELARLTEKLSKNK